MEEGGKRCVTRFVTRRVAPLFLSPIMDGNNSFQVHADALTPYDPSHLDRQISDDHDFDAAAPPPPTTYIPRGTADIAPNKSAAAQLPDLERKMAQQKTKLATVQLANGYDGSKEATTRLFAELEECAAAVTTRASPHTIAKRTLVMARWNVMISQLQPTWKTETFWHFGVVHDHAKLFLPFLASFFLSLHLSLHLIFCSSCKAFFP